MDSREKQILALRIAYIAGIFSLIVCMVMMLNYWQLVTTDPLESESLKTLVEHFQDDTSNDALKEDIRNLDLMSRNAYFTNIWQIRSGAFLLIGGIIIMVAALRIYYSSKSKIPEPDSTETPLDIELLISRRWILYTLAIVFGLAIIGSFLSIDHLSSTYALAEPIVKKDEVPVQEIITSNETIDPVSEFKTQEEAETPQIIEEQEIEVAAAETKEEPNEKAETAPVLPVEKVENNAAPTHTEVIKHYPSFRGPYGLGISNRKNIPTSWDGASGENVLWKVKVPLPGFNSPVIWDNQVFLTGADKGNQKVYCYNLSSGVLIWEHQVSDVKRASPAVIKPTEDTGFAAPTVATDGRYVFAIFATGDLVCLDLKGSRIWDKNMGTPDNHYGHSSSILVWKDLLFIQFDTNEAGKILALNAQNGDEAWSTPRKSKISWASPILANLGDHLELVLASSPQVAAYNPETGKELWSFDCLSGEVGPSPGYLDGVVFAANEYANLVAIKPGSPAEILWESNEYLPEVASPVAINGMLFIATSYGVIACFDVKSGEILWEYEGDQGFYSSPIIADGKIYFMDMDGIMHIFSVDKSMKVIGTPDLGERCVSTPALAEGKILLRGYDQLYCIGK